ncbi:MAG: ABC transporter ATP-binding protein [Clostridium sp.]
MTMAVEIKNLSKIYDTKKAVDSISLNIKEGTLLSLLGVNGAGKTTTIKMLSGLTEISNGEAYILGKSVKNDLEDVKKLINISPQDTAVAPNLTVKENLEFIAEIYNCDDKEEMKNIVNKFSLDEVLNIKAKTLSGGWQRRLSIAMALITKPKVLFLDEPTLGLDVIARRELWKIISSLKGKITIILTTHYMEEAEELSDYIAIMVKGNIIKQGTLEEIKELTKAKNLEEAFIKIVEEEK